jgi:YVTN family beta-propeller protein
MVCFLISKELEMCALSQWFAKLVAGLVLAACALAPTDSWAERGGKIVVANRGSGTLSVIDARTGELAATVPMPPGDAPPEPMYIVNTHHKNRVWVGDRANDRVVVFDGDTFEVEDVLPAGAGVFHMAADEFDSQLWIVNDIDKTATVINPGRLRVRDTVPMPADLVEQGATPHDVILDPFGIFAYITFNTPDPDGDVVVQFDTHTRRESARATVGKAPHVAFVWRTWELYLPCQGSNGVFVVDATDLGASDLIRVPGSHGAMPSPDGKRFYTTNLTGGGTDGLVAIDTRTNEIIGTADTPTAVPHNIATSANGRKLFVTHSGPTANQVSIFDADGKGPPVFRKQVTVGLNPFAIALVR